MTKVGQLKINNLKKGMKFKSINPNDIDLDYVEVKQEEYSTAYGQVVGVEYNYTNGTATMIEWYDWEINHFHLDKFELIEEKEDIKSEPVEWHKGYSGVAWEPKKICWHSNKKKVLLFASAYWLCPDCKEDLGTCSDEEYQKCLRENI